MDEEKPPVSFADGIGLKPVPITTGIELGMDYLKVRGFEPQSFMDATGIYIGTEKECFESCGFLNHSTDHGLFGLVIPYPETAGYKTVRWLNQRRGRAKMLAPKNVPPPTYIPTVMDYTKYDGTIYICESAIKALSLAVRGYFAIAGNGVDGLATRRGFPNNFPDALIERTKKVVVLFDSDMLTNVAVAASAERLYLALRMQWNHLHICTKLLTAPEGEEKWGIDDAIAYHGGAWLRDWLGGEEDENPIHLDPLHRHFVELNAQYVVCHHPVGIVNQDSGNVYKDSAFKNVLEAPRTVGNGDKMPISAAASWLKYGGRNWVKELRYQPGGEEYVRGEYFNKWADDGATALGGQDVRLFTDYMKNAVPDDESRVLLLQSVAWMMQNRGTRLEKTFMLVGAQQSTGKSTFAKIVAKCFGRTNAVMIDPEKFKGRFNSTFVTREVVVMDEVHDLNASAMARLKQYVTSEYIEVEAKGIDMWTCQNYAVYFMTSNETDSLALDDADRRVLIVEFAPTVFYGQGNSHWRMLYHWLENEDGYGKVRGWLEAMDLGAFDPAFMPPMNAMKTHMVSAGRSDRFNFVAQLMTDPDGILPNPKQLIYPARELEMIYSGPGAEVTGGDVMKMSKALGKKFKGCHSGKSVRFKGTTLVYWAIKGGLEWDQDKIRDHLEEIGAG